MKAKADKVKDIMANVIVGHNVDLSYVVEHRDWIIRRIGEQVTSYFNARKLLKAQVTTAHEGLRRGVIHFGSVNTFIRHGRFVETSPLARTVLTWFHIRDIDEPFVSLLAKTPDRVAKIHTACTSTKDFLVSRGVPQKKIAVIPLGVNLNIFSKRDDRSALRSKFGIPEDVAVVGSFQKDGVGWEKGFQPKLIKGPDILAEVLKKLKEKRPVFVLLVGPARGWLEEKLRSYHIPYKSIGYLKNPNDVAQYYRLLDMYLITSRLEGGPQQILEAWASGIPVVATRVGMIPDIAIDGDDTLLAEPGDIDWITQKCDRLLGDKNLRLKLMCQAEKRVASFSWDKIIERYYNEIYKEIL